MAKASVTGNEVEKSPEAIRQERYRAELESKGLKEVTIIQSDERVADLDYARKARGGVSGAYSRREYLETLIRRDIDLLKQQEGQLVGRICEGCRKELPRGCNGVWASETSTCMRAQADQALAL